MKRLIVKLVVRSILLISVLVTLVGCQTSRETTTTAANRATGGVSGSFDKKKSAMKRAEIGLTYLGKNVLSRAKFHLDKALEYDEDLGAVHYGLGIYYQRVEEEKLAHTHFKRALKIESKNPTFLNAYGAFLCEQESYQQADEMFMKAIDIPTYSDVSKTFFNVGLCAMKQNDIEKAQTYFRNALNRVPNMPGALIEMAKIEFTKARYQRTMHYVERFENTGMLTSESAWLGLRASHFTRDKDAIARYGLMLEQRFPDSQETAAYLDNKRRWM